MSMMTRTTYFLSQILLHRAVRRACMRKLWLQYLLHKVLTKGGDDDRKMRSEVHKGHHHSRRRHHSKHKRRQENSPKKCCEDTSPVPPVPSDTSGSERYFPLAKDYCDVSGSESSENSVTRKRPQRDTDAVRTVSGSDSDNDVEGDEERAKRRKKHKHKEKKKRKHNGKKQRMEGDPAASHLSEPQSKLEWETGSDHSPARRPEEQMLISVKQEPLSSDEETRHRQRARGQKQWSDSRDGYGHSKSDVGRARDGLRPDRHIKEEPRDRSSSHERKPLRNSKPERRNGASDSLHDHRERRNGRVNGETSSTIKNERDVNSRSRGRDRRQRNSERVDRSRDNRSDSREGPRRIKRERPNEDEREYEWGKPDSRRLQGANNQSGSTAPPGDKKKPDFGLSGKLTEDINVFNGVVIKYSEPPEARKPKRRWRFYPFKGDDTLPTLYLHRQSAYLIGRDRKVADIPVDHPSCSKQHAALQYRLVPFTRENGTKGKRVRPYIIDLESANGTFVNNKCIEPRKYVELMERDVVKFGYSSRDYVLLHEQSKGDEEDDDQNG